MNGSKHLKKWYRGSLRQPMVVSYCLDQVVPEGRCQVSRRPEVGNHKRRTLNTQLSSGTSAGAFACPAGPLWNYLSKHVRKTNWTGILCKIQKKGPKIGPSWISQYYTMPIANIVSCKSAIFLFHRKTRSVSRNLEMNGPDVVALRGTHFPQRVRKKEKIWH